MKLHLTVRGCHTTLGLLSQSLIRRHDGFDET